MSWYKETHYSILDGSPAMMIHEDPFVLINEDGEAWTEDAPEEWRPLDAGHPHDFGYYEEN